MDDNISTAALSSLPPSQSDPNMARMIYAGREFKDHGSPAEFGKPLSHQDAFLKIVGPQSDIKSLAMFWSTGLGKGFTMTALIRTRLEVQREKAKKGNRIMIIVKDSAIQSWHAELAKYEEFTTAKIRDPNAIYDAIKGREKAISSAIAKVVKIVSLDAFAMEIMHLKPEAIREKYSCDMVVIDEAHFLRMPTEVDLTQLDKIKKGSDFEGKIVYEMMHKFFNHAEVGLRILCTATPMYNSPIELVSLMSFVLPPEKQLTVQGFQAALDAGPDGIRAYLQRLKGYVSFVSDKGTLSPIYDEGKTFMFDDGDGLKESTIKIVECKLLPEQEAAYLEVLRSEQEERNKKTTGEVAKDKRPGAFLSSVRQVLNFLFIDPNNPLRNTHKGFEFFYDPENKDNSKDGFVVMTPSKRKTEREKKELINKKAEAERNGVSLERVPPVPTTFAFRYERDLFAGCTPLSEIKLTENSKLDESRMQVIRRMSARFAKIIEIVHYDNKYPGEGEMAFYHNELVKAGGGILLGMCFQAVGYELFDGRTDDATRLDDRPRYAYMTGDPGSTAARSRNVRVVANHPSNAFGKKIKIIIGSNTTSFAVSFANARKMIHNGGTFSLPRQPEGRTNRTDSHRNFKEQRQKFVRRYLMACVMGDGSQTADHRMWWNVQQKGDTIVPLEEIIYQELACDAGLHPGPLRESFKGTTTDFTRYHMHYAEDEYVEIEKKLQGAFQIQNQWTFEQLKALMGFEHRPDTLCWALRRMLDRRDVLLDRFGFMRVLRENNGIYFIANPIETLEEVESVTHGHVKHSLFESSYCSGFAFNAPIDFRTISAASLEESSGIEDEDIGVWWDYPDAQSAQKRMFKLEQALLGKIKNEDMRKFILKDLEVAWFQNGEYYFHYIDEMRPKGNEGAYQFNRRRIDGGKSPVLIRIAKKGDKEFRAATPQETAIAVNMINDRWAKRDAEAREKNPSKFSILKLVSSDREIRFRDGSKDIFKANGEVDNRGPRGKKAILWEPSELVEILYQLDLENEEADQSRIVDTRVKAEVSRSLGERKTADWDLHKMRFFHGWLLGVDKVGKEKLISTILNFATKEGFLIKK
jgi:hypothetical protein